MEEKHMRELTDDQKEGAGCLIFCLMSFLDLAASVVVGAIFGWYWGVALYFAAIGAFGLWLVRAFMMEGK